MRILNQIRSRAPWAVAIRINETSHGHGRRKVNHLFKITRYGMAVALKAIT